jgi:hypothetical protein
MSYKDTFPNRKSIVIDSIESDDDAVGVPSSIEFAPQDNPDINVDTAGQFAKHDIVGGGIVRQKIGYEPYNITVKGVCDEETAKQIDLLRGAKQGTLISDRKTQTVQFASMSTQVLSSGGAVDADTGDYLYQYTLNLVSVDMGGEGGSGSATSSGGPTPQ